jgi:hypothetical protein
LFFFVLALLLAAPAAHADQDWFVYFDRLDVYRNGSKVVVSWEVNQRDWDEAADYTNAAATLVTKVGGAAYSVAIKKRRGKFSFRQPRGNTAVFRVKGSAEMDDGEWFHYVGLQFGPDDFVRKYSVRMETRGGGGGSGSRDRGNNWAMDASVMEACDAAFVSSSDENACVKAVKRARYNPTSMIGACDTAFVSSADVLSCVRSAATTRRDTSRLVAACDDAFVGSSDVLSCIKGGGPAPYEASSTVAACDTAFVGSSDVLACVDLAAQFRQRPVQLIESCDEREVGSSAVLECIRAAL